MTRRAPMVFAETVLLWSDFRFNPQFDGSASLRGGSVWREAHGSKFADVMDRFSRELANRPLPERLENFDSALAGDTQQRALLASWADFLLARRH